MKPIEEGLGPNQIQLLSTAGGHCLNSNLLYRLGKAKVKVTKLVTIFKTDVERN